MTLPKISTPTYELDLLTINKPVKYRPFLVREEKILIIAQESKDTNQIINAIKEVLKNCILTRGVKVSELAIFELEYLFLNLRCKSVGETIEVQVTCPDDNKTKLPLTINLDEIKLIVHPDHKRDIKVDDKLTIRMKYPSVDKFIEKNFTSTATNKDAFDLVSESIEQIFSDEESWVASDYTKEQLDEFINDISHAKMEEIDLFFRTIPKLSYKTEIINPKTGVKSEIEITGLTSFLN